MATAASWAVAEPGPSPAQSALLHLGWLKRMQLYAAKMSSFSKESGDPHFMESFAEV